MSRITDLVAFGPEEESHLPSANIDFKHYSREMYEKKKRSPERFSDKFKRVRKQRYLKKNMNKINNKHIDPHSAEDNVLNFMTLLPEYIKQFSGLTEDYDTNLVHVENLFLFLHHVSNSSSLMDYACATLTYMKFYMKTSVSKLLVDMCDYISIPKEDIVRNSEENQQFVPHSSIDMNSLRDSWAMLRNNPIFPKISFLITAAMASSICSIKELNLDFAGIKLIHLEALKQQASSCDIIDAVISTFSWIQETGWCCLKERSLSPILYSDQRLRQYTEDCNYVISMADALRSGNVEDVAEFERKLDKCVRTTCEMQKVTPSVTIKELLQRKYASLIAIKNDLIAKRKNTAYREAPIGFSIHGESSIGKSDIAELTMKHALNAMGVSDSKEGIITLNECDKYDSTYTSDVLGVFIDDAANSASTFAEKSPTQKYIQMFNNMAAQAVKAELNEKGCVFINFLVGVITTNIKTLDANLYSNYPVAVLRRFIHVNARVKPEYRVSGGTSLNVEHPDLIASDPDHIVDVWLFDIEEVIADGSRMGKFQTLIYVDETGKKIVCRDLDLQQYLKAVIFLSRKHRARQMKQVMRNKRMEKICCCEICGMIPQFCNCVSKIEPHSSSGDFIRNLIWRYITQNGISMFWQTISYFITDCSLVSSLKSELSDMCGEISLIDHLDVTCGWLPPCITNAFWFRKKIVQMCLYRNKRILRVERLRNFLTYMIILGIIFICYTQSYVVLAGNILLILLWMLCDSMIADERTRVLQIIDTNSNKLLLRYGEHLQSNWKRTTAYSLATVAAIATLLHMWNKSRRVPHALSDLDTIDKKPGWFGFTFGSTKGTNLSSKVVGSTCTQLKQAIKNNIAWCRFTYASGTVNKCNVFFLRKSLILIPRHVFHEGGDMRNPLEDLLECVILRNHSAGGKISFKVRYSMSYQFENMDMVAAYLPNCPDVANVTRWFLDKMPSGRSICDFYGITEDLAFQTTPISVEFGQVSHRFLTMQGGRYQTAFAQKGACMSPILSDVNSPAIVGFHIGGDSARQLGICMTLTKQHLLEAERWFDDNNYNLSANKGDIPREQYGKPVIFSEVVNPKAKYIQELSMDNEVYILGSTKLRSAQSSEVEPSLLSPYVEKIMGVPNKWGSPKLSPNWSAFNANIEQFSNPGDMFDPKLLLKAKYDWMRPMSELLTSYVLWEQSSGKVTFRPLTLKETILGIDGIRFIDAMPMNTGIGFPIFGKKNKVDQDGNSLHFDEIRNGEKLVDRIPKQHIMDEYNRMLTCYKRNERAYPVTSATLKDEPTLLTKEKVRVFQAAPVALGLLIRMYFLPVARFLCCHPIEAETAVGVNAFGPEWQELMAHAEKYKFDDNMLGWDYSKYDVRMNSQMTRAVWDIFIDLACIGGYPADAIQIMKAMVVDICHPLIDMNGTLLMATSMNTSGNNMTVYVNSLAGSLYVRMGFFSIYPEENDFRQCVALLTYGDDAIGSVKQRYKDFNFISYKKFLGMHGMKLTLPSKTDEEVAFLKAEEVDFLKRKNQYIPEIDASIGKLDEDSIFKSLHSNLKSRSVTPREVACSCIEGALHEWFAYGKQHYELRRQQLSDICNQINLPVHALHYSFEDRVKKWKECYSEQGIEPHTLNEEFMDTPCGAHGAYTPRQLYAYLCGGSLAPRIHENNHPDEKKSHLIGSSNSPADKEKSGSNGHVSKAGKNAKILKKSKSTTEDDRVSPNCVVEDINKRVKLPPTMGTIYHQMRCAHGILNAMERNIENAKYDELRHQLHCAKGILMSLENNTQEIMISSLEHLMESQYEDAEIVFEPHSATETANELSSGSAADGALTSANVEFADAHPGYADYRGQTMDPLRNDCDEMVSLNDFFKRPVKVANYPWNVGAFISVSFDPWSLFFENKRVINRLANFRLLSCVLHVKFVVNGTSLHYGRAMASYRPLPDFDGETTGATSDYDSHVLASQRPHVFLNPTTSQGGHMVLPFFTPYTKLDITTAGWRQMGDMDITTLAPLKHANAGTTPVQISVFVWAEKVVLSGLTHQNPQFIVPQSNVEYTGIISKPASALSKIASYMTEIPYIGNFAVATEIGAKSIAKMANFFGYSRPQNQVTEVRVITATDNSANADGRKFLHKITIDSQQELTIDPTVAGLEPKDELTINSIASRESILERFLWSPSDDPEKLLFNIVVDPMVIRPVSGYTDAVRFTALGFATHPFNYWRGTLNYRFQVISSAFHKGRLKFVWDPFGTPTPSAEYNTMYTKIIDISEENDFVISCGWGQNTTWRHPMNLNQPPELLFRPYNLAGASAPVAYNSANLNNIGNGVLAVYVVNTLTTPNSAVNNDITVVVSVSAGSDYEVACPSGEHRYLVLNPYPLSAFGSDGPFTPPNLEFPGLEGSSLRLSTENDEKRAAEVQDPFPLVTRSGIPFDMIKESEVEKGQPLRLTQELLRRLEIESIEPQSAPEGLMNMDVPVEQINTYMLGTPPIMDSIINKIYMGEVVVSFRALLKRFHFHEFLNFNPLNAGNHRVSYVRRNFPLFSGPVSYLVGIFNMAININGTVQVVAVTTLMNYLAYGFAGFRGGVRYMIDSSWAVSDGYITATENQSHANYNVINANNNINIPEYIDGPIRFRTVPTNSANQNRALVTDWMPSTNTIATSTQVNPITTVEIPYQMHYRFTPIRRGMLSSKDPFQGTWEYEYAASTSVQPQGGHFKYVAAGEDFQLLFYMGPPALFRKPRIVEPYTIG